MARIGKKRDGALARRKNKERKIRKKIKKGVAFWRNEVKIRALLGAAIGFLLLLAPDWRNRQTRWIQNPLPARASRFDSGIRYLTPTRR